MSPSPVKSAPGLVAAVVVAVDDANTVVVVAAAAVVATAIDPFAGSIYTFSRWSS